MPTKLEQLHGAVAWPSASSRRCRGSRNSAPSTPVLCWASAPTMTFSSAVIVGKSRMFWNVRAMPSLVIWCRLRPAERLAR